MSVRVSGIDGELRHGYHVAARLGVWHLQRDARGEVHVRARVVDSHPHWIRERPLELVLRLANMRWAWTGSEPAFEGGEVAFRLQSLPTITRAS